MNVKQLVSGKNAVVLLDLLEMGEQFAKGILFYSALKGSPRHTVFFGGAGFLVISKIAVLVLEEDATASIINICWDCPHQKAFFFPTVLLGQE